MLAPYRLVLAAPGAAAFSGAGFLARLPMSTMTLGIVLLVAGRTGSYGLAGTVSGVYMVTAALSSPVLARLIDSRGQRRLLVPCMLGFAAAMVLLVLAVEGDWPTPLPHLMAGAAGIMYPPVGACIRARWTQVLEAGPSLQTAFAFEAVVDESVFIFGPVLVTLLATRVHEAAGILAVLVVAVSGGLRLASLVDSEPPTGDSTRRSGAGDLLGGRWLAPVVAGAVCLGLLFGSCEVIAVAFADEHGEPGVVGYLLAVWAGGSLIAGLVTGSVQWQLPVLTRYRAGAVVLAASMLPLPFVDHILLLAVVLFLGGFAISPTLVSIVSLIEVNVPQTRLTEGMTWLGTGLNFGVAPGAAVSGLLIDHYGASTAFWLPAVAGVLAAGIAFSTGEARRPLPLPE